jgi:hypothetical protein
LNTGGTGVVSAANTQAVTLETSQSGGSFSVTATGGLTVDGVTTNAQTTTSLGSIKLVSAGGTLNVDGNVTANGGSIIIQNSNATTGAITLGNSVDISTDVTATTKGTNGLVSIYIGTATSTSNPSPPATPPAGITVPTNTGKVYFGAMPGQIVQATPGTSTLTINATNQNVLLNAPAAGTKITFGTGDTITADPQAPANAPISFSHASPDGGELLVDTGECESEGDDDDNTVAQNLPR